MTVDYNRDAREYARHRRVHPGILTELAGFVTDCGTRQTLEIGVGSGNMARALEKSLVAPVIGVDPSRNMLAIARERGSRRITLGRAEALPFANESFCLTYLVDVIHHIQDRAAFASSAFRVLQPGGTIVIATDSELDLPRRVPLSSHFPETVAYELTRYPDSATIELELMQAGFIDLERRFVSFRYELTDPEPYREKAFSSLHGISAEAFERGMRRLETDLEKGPIEAVSLYTLFVGHKPAPTGWRPTAY